MIDAAAPVPVLPEDAVPVKPAGAKAKKLVHHGRRNWIIALLILVPLAAVGSGIGYERSRPAESPFRTVEVARADVTQEVTATGSLQPVVTSPVGAQVSGIVSKLYADYNSQVKAGQLLVELDPALFQNAVALATAQLAQAEANFTSAQASEVGARIARDRTQNLRGMSIASDADVDATRAIFGESAGASRSNLAQVAAARAALSRAKLDLEHSIIRSPVDGTVISRNIDIGQAVAATLTAPTLFTIAQDLTHMQVHAAVDEADIGVVRAGQAASFTVDAFRGQSFHAVVLEVRNAPQTAQNVVTYDVVLNVDNPDLQLRPGMTANVLILIVSKSEVVAVPNEALRFRPVAPVGSASGVRKKAEGPVGAAVYVERGTGTERVPVTVGVTDGNLTEVEGVDLGTKVIIDVVREKGKGSSAGRIERGP